MRFAVPIVVACVVSMTISLLHLSYYPIDIRYCQGSGK